MIDIPLPAFRRAFDAARDPLTARNALGLTDSTGTKAPASAEYVTAATDATLTNERVLTNTASITWDFSTPGQAKASTTAGGGNVSNSGTPAAGQLARWVTSTTIEGVSLATAGIQPLDTTLTALAAYNTNGLLTQTAADTFTGRTLTGPAAGITVTNGNGVAGNPTLALADDLAALEALAGTGTIYYRSGTSAWSAVTIGTGLTFTAGTLDAPTFSSSAKGEVPASGGGTANFLRADGTWTAPAGSGNVSNSGTPANDQVAVWTDATHVEGTSGLTFSSSNALTVTSGSITLSNGSNGGIAITGNAGGVDLTANGPTDSYIRYFSKGTAGHHFYTNGTSNLQAVISHQTTSGYLQITGGDGSTNLTISTGGSVRTTTPTPATDSSTKIATTAFCQGIRNLASTKDAFCATLGGTNQPGFAASVWAKGNFNTEAFDQNSKYDTTNYRWTPDAGLVLINAQIFMGSLTAGTQCNIGIYKNGTLLRQASYGPAGDGSTSGVAAITVLDIPNGTDYYECWAIAIGAAGGTLLGTTALTFFQGYQL